MMPQTVKERPETNPQDCPKRDEKFHRRLRESADKYTATPLPPALRYLAEKLGLICTKARQK